MADGSILEARRRKGNKNTLVGPDDQPTSEDALARALGTVTRKTFQTEFGLTAEALRNGGEALLKAGGGLAETLAASSAGLSALSRLRETLQTEADGLFTSRRSAGKPFYLALDRYDAADKRLREAIVTSDAVKAAQSAALEAEAREGDLKAQHAESGRALARWRRAARTRGKLARLAELDAELATLNALPAVESSELADWRAALAELRALGDQLDALQIDDADGAAALAALPCDAALLARGSAIEALREETQRGAQGARGPASSSGGFRHRRRYARRVCARPGSCRSCCADCGGADDAGARAGAARDRDAQAARGQAA